MPEIKLRHAECSKFPRMKSLKVKSPAKINLSLRVLRRRPDGYHDLVTLFHRISLADEIKIRQNSKGFELRCSDPLLPVDEKNLITKTYRLLQQRFPKLPGVSVFLTKKVPVGAGLGGGSGNAAAFLLGMKRLFRLKMSQSEMMALGGRLGADIPFFILNCNQAMGLGKGEKLKKLSLKRKLYFVLAASSEGLSTRDVYENMKGKIRPVSLTKVSREITMLCAFLARKKVAQAGAFLSNDLEYSAFEIRPSLRNIIESFKKRGIQLTRMTGSGPTVFGICFSLREAERAAKDLRKDLPANKILICSSF